MKLLVMIVSLMLGWSPLLYANDIMVDWEELLLIDPDMGTIAPVSGDGVGNGAGEIKLAIITAEQNLAQYIKICIALEECRESQFLERLVASQQQEQLIEFSVSDETAGLLLESGEERFIYTGSNVGSENIINTQLLSKGHQSALKYVVSLYSAHHADFSLEQKGKELQALYQFVDSLVVLGDFTSFKQEHIKVVSLSSSSSLYILDNLNFYAIPLAATCDGGTISFHYFNLMSFYRGRANALAEFKGDCGSKVIEGRLDITLFFNDGVDWLDFFIHPDNYVLNIRDVQWQEYIY